MTEKKGLADILKHRRQVLNLTQSQAAEMCGLTKQSIHTWEIGDRGKGKGNLAFAKFSNVLKYCQALGIESIDVNGTLENLHTEG